MRKKIGVKTHKRKQFIQQLLHHSCNTLIIGNSDAEGIVEEIIAKNFKKLKTDTSNKSKIENTKKDKYKKTQNVFRVLKIKKNPKVKDKYIQEKLTYKRIFKKLQHTSPQNHERQNKME